MVKLLHYYDCYVNNVKIVLINEFSDIKLVCGLKSYSIRLVSPNDKTIILCFFINSCGQFEKYNPIFHPELSPTAKCCY